MLYTLKSDLLTVVIEDAGAQLASVKDNAGTEYLWQGDPDIWPRRAPLLFPIIARLKDSLYTLDGKEYKMANHGFCRSAPFIAEQKSDTEIAFRYSDTEETRAVYPFSFSLTVTYTLEGDRLIKTHRVENRSETVMYYELGGHDGYRVPLAEGEKPEDYAVRVPGLDAIVPYGMDDSAMICPKGEAIPLTDGRIAVKPSVYGLDTVILDGLPCPRAMLVDGCGRPRVSVEFGGFPYLGIWTANKPDHTGYVCIEPWTTLPDATFVGRGLADKAGIRALDPGAAEELRYTVTFLPA